MIDPGKPVEARGDDLAGRGLPYWPSYSDIDARCRATYLDWLAGGRKDPACGVGYVFLYFYGLERRYFVDEPDSAERARLVAEVERLLGIYGENGSVRRYFGAFLDAAPLLMPDAPSPEPIFERRGYEMPLTVRVALGRMVRDGMPLTADWLLCWLTTDPESRLRTPAERAFPEFKALFRQLFEEKYPGGLKVRTPKRRLKPQYPAASGTFETDLVPFVGEVPEISGASKPLSVAATIAEEACQALDKFSRYLGRDPEGRGTLEGHALLPESLWKLFPCPELEDLERWACERIEHGGLVQVTELVERMEGARPDRLGKRQLTDAADALARLSIGVAPDPRFSLRKPKAGEPVVLFSLPEGETQLEQVSEGYRSALLALALGSFVAHSDGAISEAEHWHLRGHVDVLGGVTASERARLHANLRWLAAVPPDLSLLGRKASTAPLATRREFGRMAIAVAGADATIDAGEVRAIEKLYRTLGLDPGTVYGELHALSAGDEPVTVYRPGTTAPEYGIPPQPAGAAEAGPIALDAERISAVVADTAHVSHVLNGIFADGDDAEEEEPADDGGAGGDEGRFPGLDAPHGALASELLSRPTWTEEEFRRLSSSFGLMPAGALETLNEWAFERHGDALIEVYDSYDINPEIAAGLSA